MSLLTLNHISRSFGGLTAVNDVSLSVAEGEIFSLIGPNGAGKTTLLNVVSGFINATRGTIEFAGKDIGGLPTHELARCGIIRTFQVTRLFKTMTVLDNIKTGQHCCISRSLWEEVLGSARNARLESVAQKTARALAAELGIDRYGDEVAGNLPFGTQRLVEIARALASSPRLLLLDEPGAGMSGGERQMLMEVIKKIRSKGITVLLIEHHMDIVMGISDRVAVLSYGRKIADGRPAEVQRDANVIEAYLGKGVLADGDYSAGA